MTFLSKSIMRVIIAWYRNFIENIKNEMPELLNKHVDLNKTQALIDSIFPPDEYGYDELKVSINH